MVEVYLGFLLGVPLGILLACHFLRPGRQAPCPKMSP
jgi:hypothetical protein